MYTAKQQASTQILQIVWQKSNEIGVPSEIGAIVQSSCLTILKSPCSLPLIPLKQGIEQAEFARG